MPYYIFTIELLHHSQYFEIMFNIHLLNRLQFPSGPACHTEYNSQSLAWKISNLNKYILNEWVGQWISCILN